MAASHLERIRSILVCPACHGDLSFSETAASCAPCSFTYPIRDGKIYFIPIPRRGDAMDDLKAKLKKLFGDNYYRIGVDILAPAYPFDYLAEILRFADPSRDIVVDAGCGNRRRHEDIICLDCFDYDSVDVVCDLSTLPFRAGSIDLLFSIFALEHVPNPAAVVAQFNRCTRAGGTGVHVVPFLYPYHASPGDYWRYTHEGLAAMLPDWKVLRCVSTAGPFTLAMACTAEFLSTLLSFGDARLRAILYLLCCALLFPIKYFDFFFVRRDSFRTMAPTLLTALRKPGDTAEPGFPMSARGGGLEPANLLRSPPSGRLEPDS